MKINRKFTIAGQDPFSSVKWVKRSSKIANPDGSVVFQMDDAEVPETWSQLATDIMVSKYFRKAGIPQQDSLAGASGSSKTGPEKSAKQVIHRLAGCWKFWGEKHNYFDTPNDAKAFYDELVHMLVHQMAAPNSPQWFNTGLNFAYGITGPAQGHFVPDPYSGKVDLAKDAYTHPQPHACFIQSVGDDLVGDGGIMDLWVREARLFKYGSGTGTNFSHLRAEGEKLSGGGKSSGLMSWLKIGDRAASAIKSGGTTRRAAKMVCLDMDHPDIGEFVNWKVREEIKVQAMVEGLKVIANKKAGAADKMTIGETAAKLGLKLDYDFNGEAYLTVSGQNSNNSIRIPDEFFDVLDADGEWTTRYRTTGDVAKVYKARQLWDQIGYAAWRCADPGVQFDTTINAWHTCPSAGRINASNPCSEYLFVDNTACNLASLNVLKFYDSTARSFDVDGYEHGIDLWTIVLEVSVLMASYPSSEVARLSYKYRTLGLGYANLGAMLMQAGIAYDSEEARAVCSTLTAILTGRSYRQSALMAAQLGAFEGYQPDKENMLRVIRNHRLAAHGVSRDPGNYENMRIAPVPINHEIINANRVAIANADDLLDHAVRAWDEALAAGEKYGYRNAQTTVIAPTGTIGLLMDCDTTGIEPDFALVKFKKLAGGGYFKIANASVEPALEAMGYSAPERKGILTYLLGTLNVDVPMGMGTPALRAGSGSDTSGSESRTTQAPGSENRGTQYTFKDWLLFKGLTEADVAKINAALPGVFEVSFAFNVWSLGDEAMTRLGFDPEAVKQDVKFNLLRELGLSKQQVDALNEIICGRQTVEGAPGLKSEHLSVFDCANKCGKHGQRFIAAQGHIRMMGAAQPFISGAISKTINLPNDASEQDIKDCYRMSWELGLKANALYRDGCKLSQPLNSTGDDSSEKEVEAKKEPMVEMKPIPQMASALPVAKMPASSSVVETVPVAIAVLLPAAPAVTEIRVVERPMRRRLADTRASITHKFNIGGHEGYLTVGLYEDGMPGELFITMAKEGSTIGGLMDSLGTAVSVALQYGVPIESLVNKFTHQRFEPAGMTSNRDIPFAKSLVDYIFRWMGMEFIPGYREANAPKRNSQATTDSGYGGGSADDQLDELLGDNYDVDRLPGRGRARTGSGALGEDEDGGTTVRKTVGIGGIGGITGPEDRASWNTAGSVRNVGANQQQPDRASKSGQPDGALESPSASAHPSGRAPEPAMAPRDGGATSKAVAGTGGGAQVSVARCSAASASVSALSMAMRNNQEDAPACDACGSITMRSGTCYKCMNCGASMGCS